MENLLAYQSYIDMFSHNQSWDVSKIATLFNKAEKILFVFLLVLSPTLLFKGPRRNWVRIFLFLFFTHNSDGRDGNKFTRLELKSGFQRFLRVGLPNTSWTLLYFLLFISLKRYQCLLSVFLTPNDLSPKGLTVTHHYFLTAPLAEYQQVRNYRFLFIVVKKLDYSTETQKCLDMTRMKHFWLLHHYFLILLLTLFLVQHQQML